MYCSKVIALIFSLFFMSIGLNGQKNTCGFKENNQEGMKNSTEEICPSYTSTIEGLITIPVVFHVVYHDTIHTSPIDSSDNISYEQISSQIEVLNEDCNSVITAPTMWHEVAANIELEFCLATRDPFGNPTCGITRTYTDSTIFKFKESVKDESTGGVSGWPVSDYLNVWICDMDGLRGHATFPGGVDSLDGIAIDYEFVGRGAEFNLPEPAYDLGKTATHEVGHWLRLKHIWGDGLCNLDDLLTDTPAAPSANYGCNEDLVACEEQCPDYEGPLILMVQNYMDYSDDACMNLFTQDQVSLARKAFDPSGARSALLTSLGCSAPVQNAIILTINFDGYSEETSWQLEDDLNNIIDSGGDYEENTETVTHAMNIPNGDYTLKFFDSWGDGFCCGSGPGDYEVKYASGAEIVSGTGEFEFSLSIPFPNTLTDADYRFIGGSDTGDTLDWYNPANWNKLSYPLDCYYDDIIIEADCEVDEVLLREERNLIILDGAKLIIKD